MKHTIRMAKRDYDCLYAHLFRGTGYEEAAFLLAETVDYSGNLELLVREVIPVPPAGFLRQSATHLEIDPDFMAPIIKRCRLENLSLIDVHSHPGSGSVGFSCIDDHGDSRLLPKIQLRVPNRPHASMVINKSSLSARIWTVGASRPCAVDRVVVTGAPSGLRLSSAEDTRIDVALYDRQILAFGADGQRRISESTIAIVGCGGLGAIVAQLLCHTGFKEIILIDPDIIDLTNRPRIPGSTPADVDEKTLKVKIAERLACQTNPSVIVRPIALPVQDEPAVSHLLAADVIICCTDNLESREYLNDYALRCLRPLVDCGTDLRRTKDGRLLMIGRVTTFLAGGPCLCCAGIVDPSIDNRESRCGTARRDPSTISYNGVVASLAAVEVVNLITGLAHPDALDTSIEYQGHKGAVYRLSTPVDPHCPVCSNGRTYRAQHSKLPNTAEIKIGGPTR